MSGKFSKKIVANFFITVAICAVYVIWVAPLKPFTLPGLKIIDGFYLLNNIFRQEASATSNMIIISIDDESFKQMNMRWPWPRRTLADIIEKIRVANPSVICLDFVFLGEGVDPSDDLKLAASLRGAGNVFAADYFGADGKHILPNKTISDCAKAIGFINKETDLDNSIRRTVVLRKSTSGNIIDYSLTAKISAFLLNRSLPGMISTIPLLKDGSTYIYYLGNSDKFTIIPAWKVLKDNIDTGIYRGKMIFVGPVSYLLHDNHQTPFGIMPGVIIAANETLAFLTDRFFRVGSGALNFAILFIFVFIATLVPDGGSLLRGIALNLGGIMIFMVVSFCFFLNRVITDPFGGIFLITSVSIFLYGRRYIVLAIENMRLREESVTDGLTGLYVYRYLELQLKRYLEKSEMEKKPVALIIYDVDYFKDINDKYGHEFGNTVLKNVSKALKETIRKDDIAARYGGDEFCVLMYNVTSETAKRSAERAIENLKKNTRTLPGSIAVTMSAGIVSSEKHAAENPAEFIKYADSALYRAKDAGRGRISIF